jgi:RNA polymerase sigma factor (sigma-70 family)
MDGRKKRRKTRSGRPTRWAELYHDLYPEVRSLLVARGASKQDADDLAEQVLTKLAGRRRPNDLNAYLAVATANALHDHRRRAGRERELLQRLLQDAADGDRMWRPEARESDEQAAQVREMLDALPAEQAKLLKLRYFDRLPMAKLARRLGCSRAAAYKRVQRALQSLRDRYAPEPRQPGATENAEDS